MHSSLSGAEQSFGPPRYIANDNLKPDDINDLLDLWGEVIVLGLRDRKTLPAWIRTEDFELVCECAGVNPATMRTIARKVISGELRIAPKVNANKRFTSDAADAGNW